MCYNRQIVDDIEITISIVHRDTLTNISPTGLLVGNALNLDRGISSPPKNKKLYHYLSVLQHPEC